MSTELARREQQAGEVVQQDALLPVMSFEQAVARRDVMVRMVHDQMKEGVDFGTIPGVAKPSLWKPGAEKLGVLFGLVATYEQTEVEDWTGEQHGGEPFFNYKLKCQLRRDGVLKGEGLGSCNSWEAKYRYRKAERVCPQCGAEAIIKGKEQFGGGWLCWKKKDGCGAKFQDGNKDIEGQDAGRKRNPEIYDQVNTCLKIGKKRCFIDGIITTTGASEFFTQDVEDIAPFNREPNEAVLHGESHEQLTQRRIDEEQAKLDKQRAARQPPPAPAPPTPSTEAPPAKQATEVPAEVPPAVAKLWAGMTDMKSSIEVLLAGKAKLKQLLPEYGESEYYRVLKHHGAEHANQFQELAPMKRVARDLLSIVETAEEMAAAPEQPKKPYQAVNDDVPF